MLAKKIIILICYIRNIAYEDIKSIDYSDDYEVNPMGGIDIKGYLNGDKQKKIWGIYDKSNDEVGSFTVDAERKPECKDKICDY
ncbi:DUF1433 domain-containing protein [Bacillus paralicheniformis]|nr:MULTISPECIES: DUF1433 domain-containing protein [Bacillus]MDU0415219.1 DUF1433 domain-containing protein [Bacillus paralicheniformis]MED1126173.1 DUF1433 domain-containing protein [Bacillus paralicheniformis]MED1712563.1 DUF1433 domain-containing protein [Bacillus paralicheniformis]